MRAGMNVGRSGWRCSETELAFDTLRCRVCGSGRDDALAVWYVGWAGAGEPGEESEMTTGGGPAVLVLPLPSLSLLPWLLVRARPGRIVSSECALCQLWLAAKDDVLGPPLPVDDDGIAIATLSLAGVSSADGFEA